MKNLRKLFTISSLSVILATSSIRIRNYKKIPATFCLFIVLAISMIHYNISIKAQAPFQMPCKTFPVQPYSYAGSVITNGSIKYLSLPSDSLPMGIVYDNKTNKVWIALYWNRSIAVIDVVTEAITIYPMPWKVDDNYYGPLPWTLALTPDGCVWFSIRSYMVTPNQSPYYRPYLGKLSLTDNTIYIYYIPAGSGSDIKFYNGYIWYLTNVLLKIDYTVEEIVESYTGGFYGAGFLAPDGDSLWCSSVSGFVTRFNITSECFDLNLTGFDRPLGIEVDSDFVYVAENSRSVGSMGTIAKINKKDFTVSRINTALITNEGPYHVLKDSYGYLWFTDNSNHMGIVGGAVYNSISPYCYFMTEVPGGSIWFSAVGSAYVGMKATGTLGKTDINRDGIVDTKDIGAVCKQFGKNVPPAPIECDVNNDGKVDTRDIAMVCKNFGKTL
jgi:streptogramin lyase